MAAPLPVSRALSLTNFADEQESTAIQLFQSTAATNPRYSVVYNGKAHELQYVTGFTCTCCEANRYSLLIFNLIMQRLPKLTVLIAEDSHENKARIPFDNQEVRDNEPFHCRQWWRTDVLPTVNTHNWESLNTDAIIDVAAHALLTDLTQGTIKYPLMATEIAACINTKNRKRSRLVAEREQAISILNASTGVNDEISTFTFEGIAYPIRKNLLNENFLIYTFHSSSKLLGSPAKEWILKVLRTDVPENEKIAFIQRSFKCQENDYPTNGAPVDKITPSIEHGAIWLERIPKITVSLPPCFRPSSTDTPLRNFTIQNTPRSTSHDDDVVPTSKRQKHN